MRYALIAVFVISAAPAWAQAPSRQRSQSANTSLTLNAFVGTVQASNVPQTLAMSGTGFRSGMKASVGTVSRIVNQYKFNWTITQATAGTVTLFVTQGNSSSNAIIVTFVAPPPPPQALSLTSCPASSSIASQDGNPVAVSFASCLASGGMPPYSAVTTTPTLSGGLFPVGTTAETQTITDSAGTTATYGFTVTVTYSAPPPPPPPNNGQVPAWGPDPLETSSAPPSYVARMRFPINQQHFTAGIPVRLFADINELQAWLCPPGHPPYVCPGTQVRFFSAPAATPTQKTLLGSVPPDPDNQDNWELRQAFLAGDWVVSCEYVPYDPATGGGGTPIQCDAPGRTIHVDPIPPHTTTLMLSSDVVLSGATNFVWSDVTVIGNGFRLRSDPTFTGNAAITNSFLSGLGNYDVNGIDIATLGDVAIVGSIYEGNGPINVLTSGVGKQTFDKNEFRENNKVHYVASNPDAGHLLDLGGSTMGACTITGNNFGGGIVNISGSRRCQIGGLTPDASNVAIGLRSVFIINSPHTFQGNYSHHPVLVGYSQGFNLFGNVGVCDNVAEQNILAEASWTIQSWCGDFKDNVVLDFEQHNSWRTAGNGTTIHGNIFAQVPAYTTATAGFLWFYTGETGIAVHHNTFDGGGFYTAPDVQVDGGSKLTTFDHNLSVRFTGPGPLVASNAPGAVAAADYNGWWVNGGQSYQTGTVPLGSGSHDVTADPQFSGPLDTQYRIDEGAVWLRQFSPFAVRLYYQQMYTPTNALILDKGAVTVVPPPVPPTPPTTTVGGKFKIWYGPKLPKLRAKAAAGDPDWLAAKANADRLVTYTVPPWTLSSCTSLAICNGYQGSDYFAAVYSLTFAYAVSLDPAYCKKAIEVVNALNVEAAKGSLVPVSVDSYYPTRFIPSSMALTYDSCGPLMDAATVAATYSTVGKYFDAFKASAFDRDGPATSNYFGGHCLGFGTVGLTMAGEYARGAEIRDYIRTRCDSQIAVAFDSGPFQGGYFVEGTVYGINQFVRLLQYLAAVKSATGEDLITTKGYGQKIVKSFIYNLKPNRWQLTDEADMSGDWTGISDRQILVLITGLIPMTPEAGYAQWLLKNMAPGPYDTSPITGQTRMLWGDDTVASIDYRPTLPRIYRSVGDNHIYVRSDWTDTATWTSFHYGSEWFTGHQQKNAGHIAVQRGSDYLLVNAGQWKGPNGVGPSIDPQTFDNQACRTNTLSYPTTWTGGYCGGQGGWGTTKLVAMNDTATYSCTTSDQTSVYNGSYMVTDVQLYIRTACIFFNGVTVVYDHVRGAQPKTIAWHLNRNCVLMQMGSTTTCLLGSSKLALWSDHQTIVTPEAGIGGIVAQRLDAMDSTTDALFMHVLQTGASTFTPAAVVGIPGGVQVGAVKVTFDANGVALVQ